MPFNARRTPAGALERGARGRSAPGGSAAPRPRKRGNIEQAVLDWFTDEGLATDTYGAIEVWDITKVTDLHQLFFRSTTFNRDIDAWDTSAVTTMQGMFRAATEFDQDLSSWNTALVEDIQSMFRAAAKFDQDLGWCTPLIITSADAFTGTLCAEFSCGVQIIGCSDKPTGAPTVAPTAVPTAVPTAAPTAAPAVVPSA
ncbi:hypothetical protein M885DRAFT_560207, partial [Pelagophyceae sp. CCMP2097]